MRLLLLPIEIPLRIASAAARTTLRVGEALLGGAVPGRGDDGGWSDEAKGEGRPATDAARANGPVSPEAAAVATARTEPPTRGRSTGGRSGGGRSGEGGTARGRRSPAGGAPARRKPSTPDVRERRPAEGTDQPRPASAPAPRDDAPHDPPDGTVADRVPTGATPVSPTAPADESDLVGSFGPERDAGAQVHVTEPWEGYGQLRAPEVVARLRTADAATKAAVALFEGQHRKRKSVLTAAGLDA